MILRKRPMAKANTDVYTKSLTLPRLCDRLPQAGVRSFIVIQNYFSATTEL